MLLKLTKYGYECNAYKSTKLSLAIPTLGDFSTCQWTTEFGSKEDVVR